MPNWQEVLEEIKEAQSHEQVRGKYLNQLSEYTKRNVIAYYSGFLSGVSAYGMEINEDDKNGFMLCCHGLYGLAFLNQGLDDELQGLFFDLESVSSLSSVYGLTIN